jgi:DNA-binding MarR family transcriptional regulator
VETPKNPTAIHHRIREGLSRVAMVMRSDDWSRARTTGLNPTQHAIVELLEGRPAGLGVKDIAFHLGVSQPTATDSIVALERKGYIAKRPRPDDKRSVDVCLTEEGRAVLEIGPSENMAELAVEALTQHEQEYLLMTLVKMIRLLQQRDAIPIQRMCVSCRFFSPFAHVDAAKPHHCNFVDAPFGQRDFRIDCRDHDTASLSSQTAIWDEFQRGR